MNKKINLPELEFSVVKDLFIKGLEKQVQEYLNDIALLETDTPDENFINSLISYFDELKDVSSAYEFNNIYKLSDLVCELFYRIKDKTIFSNRELKSVVAEIFDKLIKLEKSDNEIKSVHIKWYESKINDLLRRNKIITDKKLNLKSLKLNFNFDNYHEIIEEYKKILIHLNKLTFLINDIKKAKSYTKDKELLNKLKIDFSSFTDLLVTLQDNLQNVYFQTISELYQVIETTMSKINMNVKIKNYNKNVKINPEIFLLLYNNLPEFFIKLKKIDNMTFVEISTRALDNIILLSFLISSPGKLQDKIIDLINNFFNKVEVKYLQYEIEKLEDKIKLKIIFQRIVYYL